MSTEQAGALSTVQWRPLDRPSAIMLMVTVTAAAVLIGSRVVWSICLDDPGEFQVSAAVGGIGHPPGHAGLVSVMRLFCVALPIAPHLTVSGVNAIFSLCAVAALAVLIVRLGGHPIAAGGAALVFLVDNEFWHLAIVPEVYGTCMMLLAVGTYLFCAWMEDRRPWKFFVALSLHAFLIANRAPMIGLTVAWVIVLALDGDAGRRLSKRPVAIVATVGAVVAAAALVVILGVWFRDVPDNPYNYMDLANAGNLDYPRGNATFADKWDRLWWLLSARQFDYMFHPTRSTIRAQAIWLFGELGFRRFNYIAGGIALVATAVAILGGSRLVCRNKPAALFVLLIVPAAGVPILLIRAISHTAFLPALLFPLMLLFALGLSQLMEWRSAIAWKSLPPALTATAVWWTADASLLERKEHYSAEAFISEVDLPSLPDSALLLTTFDALALKYTQEVLGVRPDVTLLHVTGRLNRNYLQTVGRPVFTTADRLPPELDADLVGTGLVRRIHLR